ncbi:MAG: SPASM domain-containing protein [Candidatus Eremiobacteraeota bacterium]|nr:SPASM domain-containing protein [Candidatus Eremiobacteraeota bacterium]
MTPAAIPDRLRRRMLSYVNLYCNTRCNSRCITCDFWKMDPLPRLTAADVASVAASRFADEDTWFAVQGGEFSLHPEADAILELFEDRHYILFTNFLSAERVVGLVRRHRTPYVAVSLDGGREGYARIRGVDAFDRVTRSILRLRAEAEISVGFTLTPWSELADYEAVAAFCRGNGIEFGVNLYTDSQIYQATTPPAHYPFLASIVADSQDAFAAAYEPWREGRLALPCHSIREVASVAPDGTVHLCHNQTAALGNVKDAGFDAVWDSEHARALHDRYASCNACWTSCYRTFDLKRARVVDGAPA